MTLVAGGLTTKEIAGQLKLSTRTIDFYRQALHHKLGVRNAVGLTRVAVKLGAIQL